MTRLGCEPGFQSGNDARQDLPHLCELDIGRYLGKGRDVVVYRFERQADFAGHALGFLVVGEHMRQEEAGDEDGARDQARHQSADGDEFKIEPVDCQLDHDQQGYDRNNPQQQPKAFDYVHCGCAPAVEVDSDVGHSRDETNRRRIVGNCEEPPK